MSEHDIASEMPAGESPGTAIVEHHETLRQLTKQHKGAVFRVIEARLLCSFPTADDAALAALAMRSATTGAQAKLSIQIGFHYGPVQLEGANMFGEAVNVAAQIAEQAYPAQISTSKQTVDALSAKLRAKARLLGAASLQAIGPSELYEIGE